jgi:hypothetical protein
MAKRARQTQIKLAVLIGLVLILGLVFWLTSPRQAKKTANATPTPTVSSSEGPGADTTVHAGPGTDKTPTPTSTPAPTPVTKLDMPIGPNDNTGNISLSSGATAMESTCRAATGVSCYIQAKKDGQVIRVSGTKTISNAAGSDGVILDWNANKLSVGTWAIQAVASLNGQTALSDPQTLVVNQ